MVWHPFGEAGGMAPTPPAPSCPHPPETIILVVLPPSGEDMLLV